MTKAMTEQERFEVTRTQATDSGELCQLFLSTENLLLLFTLSTRLSSKSLCNAQRKWTSWWSLTWESIVSRLTAAGLEISNRYSNDVTG